MDKKKIVGILLVLILLSTLLQHFINMELSKPTYTSNSINLGLDFQERFNPSTHILDFSWYENKLSVLLSNWTIILLDEDLRIYNRLHNNLGNSLEWLDQKSIIITTLHTVGIINTNTGKINFIINSTEKILGTHLTSERFQLAVTFNNDTIFVYSIFSEIYLSNIINYSGGISGVSWSHDGKYLFFSDMTGSIFMWSNSSDISKIFSLDSETRMVWRIDCHYQDEKIMLYDQYNIYSLDYIKKEIVGKIRVDSLNNIKWTDLGKNTISAGRSNFIILFDIDTEAKLFNITADSRIYGTETSENILLAYTANQVIHKWEFAGSYAVLINLRDYRLSYISILVLVPVLLIKRKAQDINISTFPKV